MSAGDPHQALQLRMAAVSRQGIVLWTVPTSDGYGVTVHARRELTDQEATRQLTERDLLDEARVAQVLDELAAELHVKPPAPAAAPSRPTTAYSYRAVVVRVIDGDTVVADLDLGLGVWLRGYSYRVAGVDAPELHGANAKAGELAKGFLAGLLPPGTVVQASTVKADKYGGRYDAHLALEDGRDVGQVLLEAGMAVPYDGGRRA